MPVPLDRRRFVFLGVAALGPMLATSPAAASAVAARSRPVAAAVPDFFPAQDPALVQAVVGAAHSDLDRVRELITGRPALAKASWDWGFGDWESALGAASHTGRKEIAELLLAHGARPTIFSAAMLGQLGVVRAMVEAAPGIQSTPGPHGIPLLAHARAGGEPAAPVAEYLERVGGADERPPTVPLGPDGHAPLLGEYTFGPGANDLLRVTEHERRGFLQLARADGPSRALLHHGDHEFSPAGAPAVRVGFRLQEDRAVELTVRDGDFELIASR